MNIDEIRSVLDGRWDMVFADLAPELSEAMEKAHRGIGVPDPLRGGKDGFRLFKDWRQTGGSVSNPSQFNPDGLDTLSYIKNVSKTEARLWLIDYIEGRALVMPKTQRRRPTVQAPIEKPKVAEIMNAIWGSSMPLHGTLGEKYLLNRGISLSIDVSDTIRFVPRLEHTCPETGEVTEWPGIISLFSNGEGRPQTLHRIFLNAEGGKANIHPNKMVMAAWDGLSLSGGSIKTSYPDEVLSICEGVETGLAIMEATGLSVWMSYSASILPNIIIPDHISKIIIWVDKDRSNIVEGRERGRAGQLSAEKLGNRLLEEGRQVLYMVPPMEIPDSQKGLDWLDVYAMGHSDLFNIIEGKRSLAA